MARHLSTLYGIRLFVQNGLVHAAIGGSSAEFQLWILCLTYLIPIPFARICPGTAGARLEKSIESWLWIEIAFAILSIPATLYLGSWGVAAVANQTLIISGTLVVLLHVLPRRSGSSRFARSLTWPLVICGLLILLTNRGYRPNGIDLEPFGFLILLSGLGYTAAQQTFERERKLLEVEQELAGAWAGNT